MTAKKYGEPCNHSGWIFISFHTFNDRDGFKMNEAGRAAGLPKAMLHVSRSSFGEEGVGERREKRVLKRRLEGEGVWDDFLLHPVF